MEWNNNPAPVLLVGVTVSITPMFRKIGSNIIILPHIHLKKL